MKFNLYDLRKIINSKKKPKRNVVYKIGYDKFSLRKFFNDMKRRIASEKNKTKVKDLIRAIKNLFK